MRIWLSTLLQYLMLKYRIQKQQYRPLHRRFSHSKLLGCYRVRKDLKVLDPHTWNPWVSQRQYTQKLYQDFPLLENC
jgi:hypothetical protein